MKHHTAAGMMALVPACAGLALLLGAAAPQEIDPRFLDGEVEPSRQVDLSAFFSGRIIEILVGVNDQVKTGDLLAQLDDLLQQLVLKEAEMAYKSEAAIKSAQANLNIAEIELKITEDLFTKGGTNELEVQRQKAQVQQVQAALTEANEAREMANMRVTLEKEKLDRYGIKAPFDGRIQKVHGELGAAVTERDPILTLLALDPLKAEFDMPTSLREKLKVGGRYRLRAEDGDVLVGTLKTMAPKDDFATASFECELDIPNRDHKIAPGFSVRFIWPQEPLDQEVAVKTESDQ